MTLANVISMLRQFIPILEPLGEQGINQLFAIIDVEVAKLSGDIADIAPILSAALKQVALLEMRKLKV